MGACSPRKIFEFNAVRWLLRLFWGPKHHYYLLLLSWHGNKILIHFTFACMEVSIHRRFQSPGEPREGVTHASQSEFCLVFSLIIFRAMPAENVWPSCSKSVCSQVSAVLWTMVLVRAWICTDDMRASRQQANGRRCYLSQNIGPAVAGSAGPAPPPLVLYTCTIFNKSSACYSIEVLSRELVCHAITEDTTSCSKMLQLLKCAGTPCYSSDLYMNPSAPNLPFPATAGEAPHCVSALHILMMTVVQIITLTCPHRYDNTVAWLLKLLC